MSNKYPIGGYAPGHYKIITKAGEVHDVHKYINDSEGRENIWCDTWYGHHIIGQDCEWLDESPSKESDAVDPDELWDEYSEHIDDDIDSLSIVAGSAVMTRESFKKLMDRIKR